MAKKVWILIVLAWMFWQGWRWRDYGRNRVVICNVGQGDGMLVISGDKQLLVDAGPDNGKMVKCLSRWVPFWDRVIEGVVISHWDTDHSGGLVSVLKNYRINNLLAGVKPKGEIDQKYYTNELGVSDTFGIGEILFEIVSVGGSGTDENDASVVGVLRYKDKSVLLMGDVGSEVEQALGWRGKLPRSGVVKLAHHGSSGSTSRELIELSGMKVAIISVGKNKFSHPSDEVLERLKLVGVDVLRTDREGEIVLEMSD